MRPTYCRQHTYRARRRSQSSLVPNVGPERVYPLPGPSLRRHRPAISAERARAAAVSHTGAPARPFDTPCRTAAAEALPAASPPRLLTGPQPAADEGARCELAAARVRLQPDGRSLDGAEPVTADRRDGRRSLGGLSAGQGDTHTHSALSAPPVDCRLLPDPLCTPRHTSWQCVIRRR